MACPGWCQLISVFSCSPPSMLRLCATAKEYNGREERAAQEPEAPFSGRLHYSFQTPEKLYFVLDYVNGGEVWQESFTY